MKSVAFIFLVSISITLWRCDAPEQKIQERQKIRVIFDTDANNELDDQHALAYLLFNQNTFNIEGITINATSSGGNIDKQYEEAKRVLKLCAADTFPVFKGANQSFQQILPRLDSAEYDGQAAVDFIIAQAQKPSPEKLVVIAVGKLSTMALALAKDSSIANKIRLVWLGSNYPEPGEHNQMNDTVAMNYLLNSTIDFEMVTVRYGKPDGTAAVSITNEEIKNLMPGLGPRISVPVTGRHGGEFFCFGDYSVNLFEHIDYHDAEKSRALFDLAAVAIVKYSNLAKVKEISAPVFVNNQWIERPDNQRKIKLWENFEKNKIIKDFVDCFTSK